MARVTYFVFNGNFSPFTICTCTWHMDLILTFGMGQSQIQICQSKARILFSICYDFRDISWQNVCDFSIDLQNGPRSRCKYVTRKYKQYVRFVIVAFAIVTFALFLHHEMFARTVKCRNSTMKTKLELKIKHWELPSSTEFILVLSFSLILAIRQRMLTCKK